MTYWPYNILYCTRLEVLVAGIDLHAIGVTTACMHTHKLLSPAGFMGLAGLPFGALKPEAGTTSERLDCKQPSLLC